MYCLLLESLPTTRDNVVDLSQKHCIIWHIHFVYHSKKKFRECRIHLERKRILNIGVHLMPDEYDIMCVKLVIARQTWVLFVEWAYVERLTTTGTRPIAEAPGRVGRGKLDHFAEPRSQTLSTQLSASCSIVTLAFDSTPATIHARSITCAFNLGVNIPLWFKSSRVWNCERYLWIRAIIVVFFRPLQRCLYQNGCRYVSHLNISDRGWTNRYLPFVISNRLAIPVCGAFRCRASLHIRILRTSKILLPKTL